MSTFKIHMYDDFTSISATHPSIHPSVYTYQNKKNRYTTFVVGGDKQSVFAI